MYIKEFSIDGFGIFSDCSVRNLPNGLVVIAGDNECGKSTLMQFFRMVLFGPARGKKNTHPPLLGGQHGGRIRLVMQDCREILVERIGKKITIEDYNNECKKAVMKYTDIWNDLTKKMGYWVDVDNPYITYTSK
ncbi:MAG: AAA family ATPase, partial [Rubripirellula sp.]